MKNRILYPANPASCLLVLFLFFSTASGLLGQEICNNGLDDDNDGLIDCYDPDCSGITACTGFFVGGSSSLNCGAASAGVYVLDTAWASPVAVLPASTPVAGDFDGDGWPEVAVIGLNTVIVFDDYVNNMNQLWTRNLNDDSGITNTCAFDFDVDGAAELVCRDQDSLFIFDGASGAVKGTIPALAGTINERPVVVDHDGDGAAEILTVGASPTFTSRIGALLSIEPIGTNWASARTLWNQPHYVNVNINDDLSVPPIQQAHQLLPFLNNFNQQSNLLDSLGIPLGFTGGPGGLAQVTAQFSEVVAFYDVDFTNLSTGAGITSLGWDFGDGNTSTLPNPSHTYAATGTYTVCLTAVNACDTNTVCRIVTITCPVPVAGFSSSVIDDSVSFTSQAPGASGTSLLWDFGDGTSDTSANPQHVYGNYGTYTVCLYATNPCGTDTSCQIVEVSCPISPPVAGFDMNTGSGLVIVLDQSAGTGSSYFWTFNGDTSTQSNPTFPVPTTNGGYELCLVVDNQCGADSLCDTINVNITGRLELGGITQLSIFPNPASASVWVEANIPFEGEVKVTWIDLMGRRLAEVVPVKEREDRLRISTANLPEGMYLLEVRSGKHTLKNRIWIRR